MNEKVKIDNGLIFFMNHKGYNNKDVFISNNPKNIQKSKKNIILNYRVNDISNINNVFLEIHNSLPSNGHFIGF